MPGVRLAPIDHSLGTCKEHTDEIQNHHYIIASLRRLALGTSRSLDHSMVCRAVESSHCLVVHRQKQLPGPARSQMAGLILKPPFQSIAFSTRVSGVTHRSTRKDIGVGLTRPDEDLRVKQMHQVFEMVNNDRGSVVQAAEDQELHERLPLSGREACRHTPSQTQPPSTACSRCTPQVSFLLIKTARSFNTVVLPDLFGQVKTNTPPSSTRSESRSRRRLDLGLHSIQKEPRHLLTNDMLATNCRACCATAFIEAWNI